jgi:hypothetical protein
MSWDGQTVIGKKKYDMRDTPNDDRHASSDREYTPTNK